MAALSRIRWQDGSQSERSWRPNCLAGMKPFLLKLFSWYCWAEHCGVTFCRIISDITGPQSRQTMPVQVIIIITEGSMASVLRPLVTIGSPWLGIYLAECWFHNPHCAAVMASSPSYSYYYFGEGQQKIGTLCWWCWYPADSNPTITLLTLAIIIALVLEKTSSHPHLPPPSQWEESVEVQSSQWHKYPGAGVEILIKC